MSFRIFIIFLISFRVSYGQLRVLNCVYRNNDTNGYTCDITIQNPLGLNNFASIGGTHLPGMTDNDVKRVFRVSGSNSRNVPSIICDKFQNLTYIDLNRIGIEALDDKAFKNCKIHENAFIDNLELKVLFIDGNWLSSLSENIFKNQHKLTSLALMRNRFSDLPKNIFNPLQKLTYLQLGLNQLKNLRIEWFLPLENLGTLVLYYNQIEELPRNIFLPLKRLWAIHLNYNNFKVIKHNPFRGLSSLQYIHLDNNKIEAIDEKFIDNVGVLRLYMENNICVNQTIYDNSVSKFSMRETLHDCFENFDNILLGKT
jgi:hypothetical protein